MLYNKRMGNIREIVSENLSTLRRQSNMTQMELAEKVGFSNKTVSHWERGEVMPDLETVERLAEIYGVTVNDIVTRHEADDKMLGTEVVVQRRKKVTIMSLVLVSLWYIALIFFVLANMAYGTYEWQIFVFAVPCSALCIMVFCAVWGKKKHVVVTLSVFVWTLIAFLYINTYAYNLWMLFLLGAPLQVIILLGANLKINSRRKKK